MLIDSLRYQQTISTLNKSTSHQSTTNVPAAPQKDEKAQRKRRRTDSIRDSNSVIHGKFLQYLFTESTHTQFCFPDVRAELNDSDSRRRVQAAVDILRDAKPLNEEAYQARIAEFTLFRSIVASKIDSFLIQYNQYTSELTRFTEELEDLVQARNEAVSYFISLILHPTFSSLTNSNRRLTSYPTLQSNFNFPSLLFSFPLSQTT